MAEEVQEKAEKIVLRILSMLEEKDAVVLLPVIIRKLQNHLDRIASQGEIVSAVALDKEYISQIEAVLGKKLGEKVTLKNKIDKNILGGIIIRFSDMVIDQSLKRHLADLKEKVYENR